MFIYMIVVLDISLSIIINLYKKTLIDTELYVLVTCYLIYMTQFKLFQVRKCTHKSDCQGRFYFQSYFKRLADETISHKDKEGIIE